MNSRSFWLSGLVILNGCSTLTPQPSHFVMMTDPPALTAEYETTVVSTHGEDHHQQQHQQPESEQNYQWRFWRSSNHIQTYNQQDNSGEAWSKSARGEISYQRLFHAQQQIIDYVPGDLKAIGSNVDWPMLATLLNQEMIQDLVCTDDIDSQSRPIQHCHSRSKPEKLQIDWLTQEQLPASITLTEHDQRMTSRLLTSYPLAKSPWQEPSSNHYRLTDFADLGDKENDPFIKSILSKIKGGASHHH